MTEPIEVLPAEFNEVRDAITNAPTTAPDIAAVKTKVERLTAAQRERLSQIVVAEFSRATTAETRTRLGELNTAIRPTIGSEIRSLPSSASLGVKEAFRGSNRNLTYGLIGVAGLAAILTGIRDKSKKPGFFGHLLKWTGIAAAAGLMLRIPSLGRAAAVRNVQRSELNNLPAGARLDMNDAALDGMNIYDQMSAREVRTGNALIKFENVVGPPARTLLLVRDISKPVTENKKFKITMVHELGRPHLGAIDALLNVATRMPAAAANGYTTRATGGKNFVDVDMSLNLPAPANGIIQRRGTEVRFGVGARQYYTTQANFNAMFTAVSALPNPVAPATKRTLTHTLPVFLEAPGTVPRHESTLVLKFDEE